MWRPTLMLIGLMLAACQASTTGPAPVKQSKDKPSSPQQTTAELPKTVKKAFNQDRLRAAQRAMRRSDYERQTPGPIPQSLPQTLRDLIPTNVETKVIGFEIHRDMKLVRPKPGRLFLRLRLLTLLEGTQLRAAVSKAFTDAGWLEEKVPLKSPVVHPKRGRLDWTLLEPNERPATIDLTIETTVDTQTVADINDLVRTKPPWLKAIQGPQGGFEYSWFHGVHFGGVFSDIERVSIHVGHENSPAVDASIYATAQKAGYKPDDDDPRVMRGPGRTMLFVRNLGDGKGLVAHHHRKWGSGHRSIPKRR